VQAALVGLLILCPASSSCIRVSGSTPGYGAFPPLKISHIVIPNDHCGVKEMKEKHIDLFSVEVSHLYM